MADTLGLQFGTRLVCSAAVCARFRIMNDDGLFAEQRAYYQARAPEYDEWWQRQGRFDRGPELAENGIGRLRRWQLHSRSLARRVTSWS